MKNKFFTLFFLIFIPFLTFAISNSDYNIYLIGKKAYEMGNYRKAEQEFKRLLNSFPYSNVFKNNYGYFYLGMTYYKLGEFKNAIYYLEKAPYNQRETVLSSENHIQEINYFSERDFALGISFIKIGEIEKGKIYLKRVDYDRFFPMASIYEKDALKILSIYSEKAKNKLKLKFKYDLSVIDDFTVDELLKIGDFYKSLRKYTLQEKFYEKILRQNKLSENERKKVEIKYLETLSQLKEYDKIILFTENKKDELFIFNRALAFYKLKKFSKAIHLFKNLKTPKYEKVARQYMIGLYFSLSEYEEVIETAKEANLDINSIPAVALSYFRTGNKKKAKKMIDELLTNFRNVYVGVYFEFLTKKQMYADSTISLEDTIMFVDEILKKTKKLPDKFLQKADELEINQLSKIAKLKDRELLIMSFDNTTFLQQNTLTDAYATTVVLEKGGFYDLAFKNSSLHLSEFLKYKELIRYNYPLYYYEFVDKASKIYDLPHELIFTIIHTTSKFNRTYLSKDSRYGLMSIKYDVEYNDQNFDLYKIFKPESNIMIGAKQLKEYMMKFKNNKLKTLIAYMYGENYLNSIIFLGENNINFSSIIVPEDRYSIQNMMLTFMFYSKLYKF